MNYSNIKTLHDVDVKDKKVILRVDFNVPMDNGQVADDNRIRAAVPTIKYLLSQNASIILMSHLGRIKKEEDKEKLTLKPVAQVLANLIGKEVKFIASNRGQEVNEAVANLKNQEMILLENTRFQDVVNGETVKHESKNNEELGRYWAGLGEVFINDAFGTAHRAHASNVGISQQSKQSAVGFLIEEELSKLSKVINNPQSPYVAIIGGAKVSDKIAVIENLLKLADKVLIGGGMAYTFLKLQGHTIGNSLFDEESQDIAKEILEKGKKKILLPIDSACASAFVDQEPLITEGKDIPDGYMGLDIGPKTIEMYKNAIEGAKTVVWNGPMGVSEFPHFATGTEAVCKAIASQNGVYSVVGGGDSAAAAIKLGYEDKFTHISTGGGASLELLEGKDLPGISSIQSK